MVRAHPTVPAFIQANRKTRPARDVARTAQSSKAIRTRDASRNEGFSQRSALSLVAGGAITMGLLWYLAAILIWWLAGGLLGALGPHDDFGNLLRDFEESVTMTAFFTVPFWFPYIS